MVKIRIGAEYLDIPPLLAQALLTVDRDKTAGLEQSEAVAQANLLLNKARREQVPEVAAKYALESAVIYNRQSEPEQFVMALVVYAGQDARFKTHLGELDTSIRLLAEALGFCHFALTYSHPRWGRAIIQVLAEMTEVALSLYVTSKQAQLVKFEEVVAILRIAGTVWEPELMPDINRLLDIETQFKSLVAAIDKQLEGRQLIEDISALRGEISQKSARMGGVIGKRGGLLAQLLDVWLQHVYQQMWQPATMANSVFESEGEEFVQVDSEELNETAVVVPLIGGSSSLRDLVEDVRQLVNATEKQLRALIVEKYQQQYGSGWVQHIEAKHKRMYEFLNGRMVQDKFKTYEQYSPTILDYASFNHLAELISAQWTIFHHIFDFKYGKKNKSVFNDKIVQISHVRNTLAHNRPVPENELLRAKVLCTDILMALKTTES